MGSPPQRDSFALGNGFHEFAQLVVAQTNKAGSIGFSAFGQSMSHRGGAVKNFFDGAVGVKFEREEHPFRRALLDRCCVPLVAADLDFAAQTILCIEGFCFGRQQIEIVFLRGQYFPQCPDQDAVRRELSSEVALL